ncbi:DUF4136 domain-containing protein [Solitalea lacus]|uniref:DUF4136 domain-containing protein n=1 Tax=Solitalea lacus TaxID=2911172 RepID=UPI001EDA6AB6|nr:DUF4136 domain-containing protein [Solitalea lacus]UKJ07849.1 DUF4136 domain-containing protein [Solitalea lacus]
MKNLLLFALLIIEISCSGPKVTVQDTPANTDWSQFKTYAFYKLDASGDTISSNFSERTQIIKSALTAELNKRGLVQNDSSPDLLINIGLVVKEKVSTRQTSFTDPDRPKYMGTRNYSWKSETVETGRYREGFATFDFVDTKAQKLLWSAGANGIIPEKTESIKKNVDKIVMEILKDFPVKPITTENK